MGLLDMFKSKKDSATETVEEVASDVVDTATDVVKNASDDAVEVAEDKKDSCCGGNCGS